MHVATILYAFATASALPAIAAPASENSSSCLPVVDLGYEIHRALWHDAETDIYKFQNVRYAREPSGSLRFRAPAAPLTNRSAVQVRAETRICPQGQPVWQSKAYGPIAKYSNPAVPFTMDGWVDAIANGVVPPINLNMNATEDCLLLDVHVPKKVLYAAQRMTQGAPVLVFIHGGGGVFGSKDGSGPTRFEPSGILQQSRDKFGKDFIFVTINYRLGAFGFLAGSEVQRDGNANAGLLDQRFALQWIQDHIHLFGGSKDHVTVMGESGGGGSILLHMAAAAATQSNHTRGQKAKLFHQAIPQSPALRSVTRDPNEIFNEFLSFLDVNSLDEARKLPPSALIEGNAAQIRVAPPTDFLYGPVVDGYYVTAPLLHSLRNGAFDKTVKILAGHNVFEGAFFFDPTVKTEEDFRDWLEVSVPGLKDGQYEEIAKQIYPAVYDGSVGYIDTNTRQMSVWGEAVVNCAYNAISEATKAESYAYEFGVSPGFHIQDLGYTFGSQKLPAPIRAAQNSLQLAIASFVTNGVPVIEDGKPFPTFGDSRLLVNITSAGTFSAVPSQVNRTRCNWWADNGL